MSVTIFVNGSDETAPSVNMSNRNAADVLATLGVEGDDRWCGGMPATEFSARLVLARALAGMVDQELVTVELPHEGGARFIDCGREAGYIAMRLEQIQEVADYALRVEQEVAWG